MKVLFVFSKVFNSADFFEFFVKGYLDELKKVCDIKSICFNIEKTEISEEEKKYFEGTVYKNGMPDLVFISYMCFNCCRFCERNFK